MANLPDQEERCETCDGCRYVSTDENRSPWCFWETLPVGNAAAVVLGVVKPIPCPECNPEGELPYVRPKEYPV